MEFIYVILYVIMEVVVGYVIYVILCGDFWFVNVEVFIFLEINLSFEEMC